MTKENTESMFEIESPTDPEAAVRTVGETIGALLENAGVERVYGSPIKQDDYVIIPAAEVIAGVGFGVGFGSGETPGKGDNARANRGGGGGGGGGGRTLSRPVAIVIAGPEGVRVEPVMDITKVALAALTSFGFMFSMIQRMRRGPQIEC